MASKQANKQATSPTKTSKPARKSERPPRRRNSQGGSSPRRPRPVQQPGRGCSSPGTSGGIDLSNNTSPSLEQQASQSEPISERVDLATARVPDADQPRASTKRA